MEREGFLATSLKKSRQLAGKSQEYMSLEMEIARKTVQNWEKGVSRPTIDQALNWFKILNISPLPYLFQYVYPEMEGISSDHNIVELRKALRTLLEVLPDDGVRQLLYLFYGDHGSSPRAVLNMVTAHLQTEMKDRVSAGSLILKNYEIASKKGTITGENHVKPNVELLKKAIELGENAAVEDYGAYILCDE